MADISRMTAGISPTSKPVTVNVTCRDCIFFEREANFTDGKEKRPCKQLGRLASQLPCVAFKVSPYQMDFNGADMLTFANIISNIPNGKLPLLAAILLQENTTRKNGFKFGQTVYVQVFPDDYLSNWAVAKIIAVDSKWVFIQGKRGFRAKVAHSSVLREIEWTEHSRKLRGLGRFSDPNLNKYTTVNFRPSLAEVPLQTVDSHGFALPEVNGTLTNAPPAADATMSAPPRRRGRPRKVT
jgi:hypothetical protein